LGYFYLADFLVVAVKQAGFVGELDAPAKTKVYVVSFGVEVTEQAVVGVEGYAVLDALPHVRGSVEDEFAQGREPKS
jgi:hypothetical protein